jgi:hypothetical protein
METIVTLSRKSVDCTYAEVGSDVQCADEEHECHTDTLAPRHLKAKDLIERERKHLHVEDITHRSIRPNECVDVNTSSLCFLTPVPVQLSAFEPAAGKSQRRAPTP